MGILVPYYDESLNLLWVTGKGDGNIKYYEYLNGKLNYYNNEYRSTYGGKGYGYVPKRYLNVEVNEVARFLKISEKMVEQIKFHVPRKEAGYLDYLYPKVPYDFG